MVVHDIVCTMRMISCRRFSSSSSSSSSSSEEEEPSSSTSSDGTPRRRHHTSHILSYSSGRARRKRRQQLARERQRQKRKKSLVVNGHDENEEEEYDDDDDEEEEDTHTIGDLIWPNPYYSEEENKLWWASVRKEFWYFLCHLHPSNCIPTFRLAWREYRQSWEGFWTQRGFLVLTKEELAEQERKEREERGDDQDPVEENNDDRDDYDENNNDKKKKKKDDNDKEDTLDMMQRNARRNFRGVKTMALMIRKQVREKTGIQSSGDIMALSRYFMEQFTEVIQQFMAGYRKGRDEEVEKMLTQYFQGLDKNQNNKKDDDNNNNNENDKKGKRTRKIKRRRLRNLAMG